MPIRRRTLTILAILTVMSVAISCSSDDDRGKGSSSTSSTTAAGGSGADVDLAVGNKVVATVDRRYQSYNIEMVELTGGQFWAPYDAAGKRVTRPPIDLASERLRNLARALGPVFIRVSGSWANSTYFDADGTSGGTPPEGFGGVLTTDQWLGLGKFADAVDGRILTSFAANAAVRDADGAWVPDQARALLQFSIDHHVPVVAAELFNEPNLPVSVPAGYTAEDFVRDLRTFQGLVDDVMPKLKIVGPGTAADFTPLVISGTFTAADVLKLSGPVFDVFSFHFYPKVSERCGSKEGPEIAFTEEYLSRVSTDAARYRETRDTYLPDAPMWITETAQAACGGDRWAATYRDVVRYVDTLGRLAVGNGDVMFHNTLAASDYGLIDEDGFVPRPDYWAAVLWARLMGPEVLAPREAPGTPGLTVYAHCTAGAKATGVTYAVVNASERARTVATGSGKTSAYVLSADNVDGSTIALNGKTLEVADNGTLPKLVGKPVTGSVEIPPTSVAFVVDPDAASACG